MIVRAEPDGRLLCIRQTSHALMAAEFTAHWGNAEFAPPVPRAIVQAAIAQHDNGWIEWEVAPALREDGYPMDFVHGPGAEAKLVLWQRGIDRAAAQHPYAALLIGRHASWLYVTMLDRMDALERTATEAFIAPGPRRG